MNKNRMYYCNLKAPAPIGKVVIVGSTQEEVSNLYLGDSLKKASYKDKWIYSDSAFLEVKKQLTEYFEGKRKQFKLKINPRGTFFQKKVWGKLLDVPYGEVKSYKEIAKEIRHPTSYRAVGMANSKNPIPIIIPCHRVVGINLKHKYKYNSGEYVKKLLLNLEKINQVFSCLVDYYDQLNWWTVSSSFEVMIEAVLSQNTRWNNVIKSMKQLSNMRMLTPHKLIKKPHSIVAKAIKPSGYNEKKARTLKLLCLWFKRYYFNMNKVQQMDSKTLRNELLLIKGIGPETADSILNYAFFKPHFVVDTYTKRVLRRTGVNLPKTYDQVKTLIESIIPKSTKKYMEYHGLMVEHAKLFCKKTPRCSSCPIVNICENNL